MKTILRCVAAGLLLFAAMTNGYAQTGTVDDVARGKADNAKSTADSNAGGLNALAQRVTVLENRTDSDTLKSLTCSAGQFLTYNGSAWACSAPPTSVQSNYTNVKSFGAVGDGTTDDTNAIKSAINAATIGGTLYFPRGNYRVSAQLLINKRLNILGDGYGSQIFQSSDDSLFVFEKPSNFGFRPSGLYVRDLYLGSAATSAGTALLQFINASNNLIENVTMMGSYFGVHLKGSLINNFVSLRSGVNIGGFFAAGQLSTNQYWVYGERFNNISPNANAFIAPALEGGTNGIFNEGLNGEGSVYVYGGTIEGMTGTGVTLKDSDLPSVISGTHFEANQTSDITLSNAAKTSITSVFSTNSIDLINGARNNVIETSSTNKINIDASARRTIVRATEVSITGLGGITNNASDTIMMAVSSVNPFDQYGTIGIGTNNPNSNPVGLTPNLKLHVNGNIKASAFLTGDIKFHKDDKLVWRMFEDEKGLYLEETATGEVSRMPMEKDINKLTELVESQNAMIQQLRKDLADLRAKVDVKQK